MLLLTNTTHVHSIDIGLYRYRFRKRVIFEPTKLLKMFNWSYEVHDAWFISHSNSKVGKTQSCYTTFLLRISVYLTRDYSKVSR